MKAMILAAGRGERLKPLTNTVPKPLLKAGRQSLIEYHLDHLSRIGIKEVIINISYCFQLFKDILGDGSRYGLKIHYSLEPENAPLETGGGIFHALPLLGEQPFLLINADIWTDYPFEKLKTFSLSGLGHLVMVDNPDFHPQGDFFLQENKISETGPGQRLTYGCIALIHPQLFATSKPGAFRLSLLFQQAIEKNLMTGEYFQGKWVNVGTVEQLQFLREQLSVQTDSLKISNSFIKDI